MCLSHPRTSARTLFCSWEVSISVRIYISWGSKAASKDSAWVTDDEWEAVASMFLLFETHFKAEWQLQDHTLFLTPLDEKQGKKSPLPDTEISVQKSIHYYLEGQMLVTDRLSGGRVWRALHPDTRMQQWYCSVAAADLWAWDSHSMESVVQRNSEPGKNLWPTISETLRKLNGKVPLTCPRPVCISWFQGIGDSTIWLKAGFARCILGLLGKNQTGKRDMD